MRNVGVHGRPPMKCRGVRKGRRDVSRRGVGCSEIEVCSGGPAIRQEVAAVPDTVSSVMKINIRGAQKTGSILCCGTFSGVSPDLVGDKAVRIRDHRD